MSLGANDEKKHGPWKWHLWGFYLLISIESLLSSYKLRFPSQKHILAKLGGFSARWYKAHPLSQGQPPARFQALLRSMGMLQQFQEKVARTFKFGQNNIFFPNLILGNAQADGSEILKKNKKINQPEQYGKFLFKWLMFGTAVSCQNHGLVLQSRGQFL